MKQKQHLWNQQTFDDIKNLSSSIGNNCKMMKLLALVYSASKLRNVLLSSTYKNQFEPHSTLFVQYLQ